MQRRSTEAAIRSILDATSVASGEDFFNAMALNLGRALNADVVLVGELTRDRRRVRTLGMCIDGKVAESQLAYELEGTPCADVAGQKARAFPAGVQGLFPHDALLREMRADGYVGVPLFDASRDLLGIMVALSRRPIEDASVKLSILELFAARTAVEIERTRAEMALRYSEERFRALVQTAGSVIIVLSPDHRVLEWNDEAERIYGYTKDQVLGLDYVDLFLPKEYRKPVAWEIQRILAGHETRGFENPVLCRDGSQRILLWNVTRLAVGSGEAEGIIAVGQDFTDRKLAAEALAASERRFRAVFNQSQQLTGLLDLDGTLLEANQTALDLAGIGAGDVIGKPFWDTPWWAHSQEMSHRIRNAVGLAATGETVRFEAVHPDAQGNLRTIDFVLSPFTDEAGEIIGLIPTGFDITERRSAEERLLTSREQLRALAADLTATEERERRRIATYLHDQIGQALAVLRMKFGALQAAPGEAETSRLIAEIRTILARLIDDTATLTFDLSPPILYELGLEPALEWIGEKICEEHNLGFEFADDGSRKPLADDVAPLLLRFVRELLINVVKHAAASRVALAVSRQGGSVLITVEDDGRGVDDREVLRRRGPGGFGLYSIRERLDAIGGRMEIVGRPERGTRVCLWAPLGDRGGDTQAAKT